MKMAIFHVLEESILMYGAEILGLTEYQYRKSAEEIHKVDSEAGHNYTKVHVKVKNRRSKSGTQNNEKSGKI